MADQQIAALTEIASRRLEALRERERRNVALTLFETQGSVTTDQVEAYLLERWQEPSSDVLTDQVVAKCAAAVEYEKRAVAHAKEAVVNMTTKVDKFDERLTQVQEQLAAAKAAVEPAEKRLIEAEELLAAAVEWSGRPAPPVSTDGAQVSAEVAEIATKTGERGAE